MEMAAWLGFGVARGRSPRIVPRRRLPPSVCLLLQFCNAGSQRTTKDDQRVRQADSSKCCLFSHVRSSGLRVRLFEIAASNRQSVGSAARAWRLADRVASADARLHRPPVSKHVAAFSPVLAWLLLSVFNAGPSGRWSSENILFCMLVLESSE
jgi:hypothetical protein